MLRHVAVLSGNPRAPGLESCQSSVQRKVAGNGHVRLHRREGLLWLHLPALHLRYEHWTLL